MALDSKIPEGPLADKWTNHKNNINLVNPANKRHIDVIIVGTGLAGGSAAATLAGLQRQSILFSRFPTSRALYCGSRRYQCC